MHPCIKRYLKGTRLCNDKRVRAATNEVPTKEVEVIFSSKVNFPNVDGDMEEVTRVVVRWETLATVRLLIWLGCYSVAMPICRCWKW